MILPTLVTAAVHKHLATQIATGLNVEVIEILHKGLVLLVLCF